MNFLLEIVKRFGQGKPKFFKTLQLLLLILGAVSALISYLKGLHIELPAFVGWLDNAAVSVSSFLGALIAQLPNEDPSKTPSV